MITKILKIGESSYAYELWLPEEVRDSCKFSTGIHFYANEKDLVISPLPPNELSKLLRDNEQYLYYGFGCINSQEGNDKSSVRIPDSILINKLGLKFTNDLNHTITSKVRIYGILNNLGINQFVIEKYPN